MKKLIVFALAALAVAGGAARAANQLQYGPSTLTAGQVPAVSNTIGGQAASSISDGGSGVQIGSPTGGAEGAGTLNATGLYVNGAAVSTSSAVLRDYFAGLTMANDASTSSSIDIAPGEAADSTNTVMMTLSASLTVNLSSSGVGGLDTGSAAASTWYGYFVINGTSGTNVIASAVTNGSIAGNGTSTGASATAGSTSVTLSASETLAKGTVIYLEGARRQRERRAGRWR